MLDTMALKESETELMRLEGRKIALRYGAIPF